MLLRIGNTTINMDQVKEINDHGERRIEISFAWDDVMPLVGEEAAALRSWLNEHATNLTPQTPDDEEWEEYKAGGGDMTRSRWEATKRELRQLNRDMEHSYSEKRMNRASRLEEKLGY